MQHGRVGAGTRSAVLIRQAPHRAVKMSHRLSVYALLFCPYLSIACHFQIYFSHTFHILIFPKDGNPHTHMPTECTPEQLFPKSVYCTCLRLVTGTNDINPWTQASADPCHYQREWDRRESRARTPDFSSIHPRSARSCPSVHPSGKTWYPSSLPWTWAMRRPCVANNFRRCGDARSTATHQRRHLLAESLPARCGQREHGRTAAATSKSAAPSGPSCEGRGDRGNNDLQMGADWFNRSQRGSRLTGIRSK